MALLLLYTIPPNAPIVAPWYGPLNAPVAALWCAPKWPGMPLNGTITTL